VATYTPPPYFPQSSLSPPNEERYKKFKLALFAVLFLLLLLIGGALVGLLYLLGRLF